MILGGEAASFFRVLTERFFDDTPSEALRKALSEGPAALGRLCFRWSAAVVRDEQAVAELTKVQNELPPSLRYVQQVRLLTAIIANAVREAYGDPVRPDIPELPTNLECTAIGNPETLVGVQCPKRRPSRAHFLCAVEWVVREPCSRPPGPLFPVQQ